MNLLERKEKVFDRALDGMVGVLALAHILLESCDCHKLLIDAVHEALCLVEALVKRSLAMRSSPKKIITQAQATRTACSRLPKAGS